MRSADQRSLSRERPIRVLFVDHCGELSGAEIGLLQLLRGFSAVEPVVLLGAAGPFASRLRQERIRVEVEELPEALGSYRRPRLPRSFGKRLLLRRLIDLAAYVRRITDRIREIDPHIVHTNSAKAHIYGGLAAKIAGVPMVWHQREVTSPATLGPVAWLGLRLAIHALPNSVVANSHRTARSAGRTRRPVFVVPTPIDGVLFQRSGCARSRAAKCVGIVGTLEPQKGHDVFLEAFAEAFASSPSVRAIVCGGSLFGNESYARRLQELAHELCIADRVRFTGFISNVERVFSRLDLLVSASVTPEGFGQSIIQALAAGVPVVATDNGGACESLRDGESALLVKPGDPRALSVAMRRVLEDPDLSQRLRRRGRSIARRFTRDVVQRQMLAVYESTLAACATEADRSRLFRLRSHHDSYGPTPMPSGLSEKLEALER